MVVAPLPCVVRAWASVLLCLYRRHTIPRKQASHQWTYFVRLAVAHVTAQRDRASFRLREAVSSVHRCPLYIIFLVAVHKKQQALCRAEQQHARMPLCVLDNVPFSEMRGDNCHQGPRTVCWKLAQTGPRAAAKLHVLTALYICAACRQGTRACWLTEATLAYQVTQASYKPRAGGSCSTLRSQPHCLDRGAPSITVQVVWVLFCTKKIADTKLVVEHFGPANPGGDGHTA